MLKRAIVVGASSGMGAALVCRLVDEGYRVAAIARRSERLSELATSLNDGGVKRVFTFSHDVCDLSATSSVFEQAVTALQGLDVFVYSAGVMPVIGDDQFDTSVDEPIVAVNLVGAIAWANLAAERFQRQGAGTIVGIGSVAGDRGRVGNPVYCASKAGFHAYLEALRNRLDRRGVAVVTIKPGPVHTPMTAGLEKLPLVIEVDTAAEQIFRAMNRGSGTTYVPAKWTPIMWVIQHIPSVIFRRMSL